MRVGSRTPLPVDSLAADLTHELATCGRIVIQAPTGSGKSTRVPQILADAKLAGCNGRIVVLQPRRMAARMLARRVAFERNVEPGTEVGYQVRFENCSSAATRIVYVTEGILLRMFQDNPTLDDVAALVFDEFHERQLQSDLGLSLAHQLQQSKKPALKICVMSATLETKAVAKYLGDCKVLTVSGRSYPVEIQYTGSRVSSQQQRREDNVWDRAASACAQIVGKYLAGHILVFMPGAYEIGRTLTALRAHSNTRHTPSFALHGGLTAADQDAAVAPTSEPKIIVATNVAETSLTIEGVTHVVDSGLARIARIDPHRGINTLLVEKIDQAAAEQRAGRAGRTAPGTCLRLWSSAEHTGRPKRALPEVRRIDLSAALLQLLSLGIDCATFPWFEEPDEKMLEHGLQLLNDLGAIDGNHQITSQGHALARLPLHPRLAALLLEGAERGCLQEACRTAAMLQGRPLLMPTRDKAISERRETIAPNHQSDIRLTLAIWQIAKKEKYNLDFCRSIGLHAQAAREADRIAAQLHSLLADRESKIDSTPEALEKCLLAAFSDHLAVRDSPGTLHCSIIHGRRGELRRSSLARDANCLIACDISESGRTGATSVFLEMATPIERQWLEELFPADFSTGNETVWDSSRRTVVGRKITRFRDLILEDSAGDPPDRECARDVLLAKVLDGELKLNGWDGQVERWIARVNFLAAVAPDLEIPPIDQDSRKLMLAQLCDGAFSYKDIKDRPALPVVRSWLPKAQKDLLDKAAPEQITLPGRKRPCRIRYEPENRQAVISSRLQDFYDIPHSQLTIVFGRQPLTVELLAPNGRPAQVTSDLDTFWHTSYPQVKKDLRGRYPKHEWR